MFSKSENLLHETPDKNRNFLFGLFSNKGLDFSIPGELAYRQISICQMETWRHCNNNKDSPPGNTNYLRSDAVRYRGIPAYRAHVRHPPNQRDHRWFRSVCRQWYSLG